MFRSSIQNGENEQLRRIAQEIIVTQQQVSVRSEPACRLWSTAAC
jgi:hypothetical protein